MTRRFIEPSLFTDEKIGQYASIEERLLFTAMIANQDDDGRLLAHPGYLRSIAFPYDDYTNQQITAMRDHLATVDPNIIVYASGGHDYIQLKRHRRYQSPRYYHPSKFPAPPGWPFDKVARFDKVSKADDEQLPTSNQEVTEQYTEGRVGIGLGKGRVKVGQGDSSAILAELSKLYENYIGMINSTSAEEIKDFAANYQGKQEWLEEGFKAAGNKRRWPYIRTILERYVEDGGPHGNGRERSGRFEKPPEQEHRRFTEVDGS